MNLRLKLLSLFALLLAAIIVGSCATQGKYKKRGAVPCPCEKNNKR